MKRLHFLADISADIGQPKYDPAAHGAGIVHLGVGAFHRAHQAVYTDDALATRGGDWRITGISLRSTDIADALNPQDGLYTVLERSAAGTSARVVGSVARAVVGRHSAHFAKQRAALAVGGDKPVPPGGVFAGFMFSSRDPMHISRLDYW